MTRRWLVLCSVFLLGTSQAAAAIGQAPPSLADRIKQLRREWSEDDEQAKPTPADKYTQVAPRAGAAPRATSTAGRGGLPQIEPRSLMPNNLFGRSDAGATSSGNRPSTQHATPTRQLSSPSAITNRPVARKSPSTAPAVSPPYSAARRSPPQRPYVDVDPDALHDELAGTTHSPTVARPKSRTAEGSPTILDDFAAGLADKSATAPTTIKSTTSRGPIALPSAVEPTLPGAQPQVAEPTPVDKNDRYAAPSFPSVRGMQDRAPATVESSSAAPDRVQAGNGLSEPSVESSEAARAFQFDAIPLPATSPGAQRSTHAATKSLPVAPRGALTGEAADARRESFIRDHQNTEASSGVLVTNAAPAITSDIRGPKQIAIGREASYCIRLHNQGGASANAVVVTVRIPAWAEVAATATTNGEVRQIAADQSASTLEWKIPRFDAQAAETLSIDLVPRASRPLELDVTWTHDPVNTRTVIEVQEPKLRLQVTGPDDVLFGKSHVYRLTLSNPGTGVAENVRINLLPPGGGEETVSTFEVGDLPPGVSKTAEVELTAREAGKLSVEAVATADGALHAEAVKEVFCRKPELEVDWRGPDTQYAGTAATYFFRVRNPGTAAADDVVVKVNLPAGGEFVSASEGHAYDVTKREVAWRVGSLGPGDDCYMELRSTVNTPGENKITIHAATASGDLADNKLGVTNVVALADLKLDVTDPTGPIAVGAEAIYEIRITNRGASAAEDVNVAGLFSAGLEPEAGEGAPYTVSDGRVAFRTISKLPAGQDIVLSIRAKASEPGTHVFRAEVLCRDLEIKLAAEETTRFYEDQISRDEPKPRPAAAVGASYNEAAR